MPSLKMVRSLPAPNELCPVNILPLKAEDAECVAALHAQCFEQSWSTEDFQRFPASQTHLGFTAWTGKTLTGIILAHYAAGEAEILTFCVAPGHRRRGIASELLQCLFEALVRLGVETLFIEVGAGNEAACGLYERHGFRMVGQRPAYYRNTEGREDALIMRRDLVNCGR